MILSISDTVCVRGGRGRGGMYGGQLARVSYNT